MSSRSGRIMALIASIAAIAALALPASSLAKGPVPRATTGAATHVLGTSALLTATIQPAGQATGYFFRYGISESYGSQTTTLPVPAPPTGSLKVKVGQAVGGLQPGQTYYYRVFAVNAAGVIVAQGSSGHHFKAKGAPLAFVVKKAQQATYGVPYILSGSLSGLGNGGHRIALQASPFPFLEPFTTIGLPGVTNAAGAFSFRVANLTSNTQFRVTTLDPLPIYSAVIRIDVGVRVALHVRSSSQRGVVRLYGTIAPAVNGAKVSFQVQKQVRGKEETVTRWVNAFNTVAKKNGTGSSRFSLVATVHKGGRYRAYVKVAPGKVVSAPSANTVVLHAAPASAPKGKKG
jgi:hypothetical protein